MPTSNINEPEKFFLAATEGKLRFPVFSTLFSQSLIYCAAIYLWVLTESINFILACSAGI